MRRLPVATLFLLFWSFHSFADQVVMSNGDRLSGLIIKSDAKALVIKTEFAGEVTVQWGAISEINSTDPLHVTVRDGKPLVGKIKSSQNNVEVETREKGPVLIPKDSISSLRNDSGRNCISEIPASGLAAGLERGCQRKFRPDAWQQPDQKFGSRLYSRPEDQHGSPGNVRQLRIRR